MKIFNRKTFYWLVDIGILLLVAGVCFTIGYATSYRQNVSVRAEEEQIPEICVSVYNRCMSYKSELTKMEQQKLLCLEKLEKLNEK
jgi:hypothetical protein